MTEEELWDEINAPEVECKEDGRVVVYYLNQQLDVTDEFVDGVCYVQLQVEDSVFYLAIKYQNGYAWSPHCYIQANMFNLQLRRAPRNGARVLFFDFLL